jgi:3-dehydroquinate synthase
MQYSIRFPTGEVQYNFSGFAAAIAGLVDKSQTIIITDENVNRLYGHLFEGFKAVIAIPPGERHKNVHTIQEITSQLVVAEAHRKTVLIGVGGGMITDITGFVAGIYMRGVSFGLVPTTLLGMVDAAIGGKNGVNYGFQKNLLGMIQQPRFILSDPAFLQTLPVAEWSNGFAEVIKYACLFDASLFEELERYDIQHYQADEQALNQLVQRCVEWKNKTVLQDEKESGMRKLLNFGHTAGHAIETLYQLPHGYAVGLGMIIACIIAEQWTGLDITVRERLVAVLAKYNLPVLQTIAPEKLIEILKLDKKRNEEQIDYILLNNIGDAIIYTLGMDAILQGLETYSNAGNS